MYVLYMAISHGIFFKVSIFQYYYIVWKYNIMYVLYMANIFVEVQHNVRTLYGYQPWYIFQGVYISRLLYCVEVQYNTTYSTTLYGYNIVS